MTYIDSTAIIGKSFTVAGGNELVCIGYASNDTFLIIGTFFDRVNNRSTIKTYKFADVTFKGELTPTSL